MNVSIPDISNPVATGIEAEIATLADSVLSDCESLANISTN